MRRAVLVLLAPLAFSAAVVAQSQVVVSPEPVFGGAKIFLGGDRATPVAVVAKVTPEEVVARMLTFDRDHDGKVGQGELAERMQPLVARGDLNRDGSLDAVELRALAVAPAAPVARQGRSGGFPFYGSYGFADESSLSSRSHIEGAIEDLKLAADTKEQALSVAKSYVDSLEAAASADLTKELEGVLTAEQLAIVQQLLKNSSRTVTVRTQNGTVTQTMVSRRVNLLPRIDQFRLSPPQNAQARGAVDRYTARIKMGETERAELLNQLKGILNADERNDLRAALARRPVVATNELAFFLSTVDVKSAQVSVEPQGDVIVLHTIDHPPSVSIAVEK